MLRKRRLQDAPDPVAKVRKIRDLHARDVVDIQWQLRFAISSVAEKEGGHNEATIDAIMDLITLHTRGYRGSILREILRSCGPLVGLCLERGRPGMVVVKAGDDQVQLNAWRQLAMGSIYSAFDTKKPKPLSHILVWMDCFGDRVAGILGSSNMRLVWDLSRDHLDAYRTKHAEDAMYRISSRMGMGAPLSVKGGDPDPDPDPDPDSLSDDRWYLDYDRGMRALLLVLACASDRLEEQVRPDGLPPLPSLERRGQKVRQLMFLILGHLSYMPANLYPQALFRCGPYIGKCFVLTRMGPEDFEPFTGPRYSDVWRHIIMGSIDFAFESNSMASVYWTSGRFGFDDVPAIPFAIMHLWMNVPGMVFLSSDLDLMWRRNNSRMLAFYRDECNTEVDDSIRETANAFLEELKMKGSGLLRRPALCSRIAAHADGQLTMPPKPPPVPIEPGRPEEYFIPAGTGSLSRIPADVLGLIPEYLDYPTNMVRAYMSDKGLEMPMLTDSELALAFRTDAERLEFFDAVTKELLGPGIMTPNRVARRLRQEGIEGAHRLSNRILSAVMGALGSKLQNLDGMWHGIIGSIGRLMFHISKQFGPDYPTRFIPQSGVVPMGPSPLSKTGRMDEAVENLWRSIAIGSMERVHLEEERDMIKVFEVWSSASVLKDGLSDDDIMEQVQAHYTREVESVRRGNLTRFRSTMAKQERIFLKSIGNPVVGGEPHRFPIQDWETVPIDTPPPLSAYTSLESAWEVEIQDYRYLEDDYESENELDESSQDDSDSDSDSVDRFIFGN